MRWMRCTLLIMAVTLTAPVGLWAQGNSQGRGKGHAKHRERQTVVRIEDLDGRRGTESDQTVILRGGDTRVVIVDPDDIERRYRVTNRPADGPAFCRSGAGHPVWGPEWCLEKGFGLGNGRVILDQGRVYFPLGGDVVVARARDDRGWLERVLDTILFWTN